jgi:hypothetical protein
MFQLRCYTVMFIPIYRHLLMQLELEAWSQTSQPEGIQYPAVILSSQSSFLQLKSPFWTIKRSTYVLPVPKAATKTISNLPASFSIPGIVQPSVHWITSLASNIVHHKFPIWNAWLIDCTRNREFPLPFRCQAVFIDTSHNVYCSYSFAGVNFEYMNLFT